LQQKTVSKRIFRVPWNFNFSEGGMILYVKAGEDGVDENFNDGRRYLTGDAFTLLDCRLIPQLYVLYTCIEGYKGGAPNIAKEFPKLNAYYERGTARPSFLASVYPQETCLWGWGRARGN
jgi:Glutathione S-transferase, C-terminal domain